jgi:1-acyl-sn-glycerol-3-phosphate acyltransferase
VVLAPPHTVLKTSSGKIRRSASRALYEQGGIGKGRRALWRQIARLTLQGLKPRFADARRAAREAAYAVWWWGVVGMFFIPLWLAVLIPPTVAGRWRAVGWVARSMLRLTGTPLNVAGLENLPACGGVLAVNHASYIDGLSIMAALPRPGRFVAKSELGRQFFARNLLGRLGTIFVERVDAARGVEDAGKAVAAVRSGELAIFFPEGTFQRRPGLLPFRLGAFQAAAEAGAPVTPAVLTGTRQVLRGGGWFPRRGSIQLHIGKPIDPKGGDWPSVLALRDAARAAMLAAVEEPDLAGEWVRFGEQPAPRE